MRKLALAVIVLFAFASSSFAAVGIQVGNTLKGTATNIKFGSNTGGQLTTDGSTWTFNVLLAGIGNGGATSMASSTLVVPTSYGFVRKNIASDSAFMAGTLADGVPGQMLTVYVTEDEGSETFVITPSTSTTFATASFDAVGDTATFLYIDDTVGWCVINYTSVTVALP